MALNQLQRRQHKKPPQPAPQPPHTPLSTSTLLCHYRGRQGIIISSSMHMHHIYERKRHRRFAPCEDAAAHNFNLSRGLHAAQQQAPTPVTRPAHTTGDKHSQPPPQQQSTPRVTQRTRERDAVPTGRQPRHARDQRPIPRRAAGNGGAAARARSCVPGLTGWARWPRGRPSGRALRRARTRKPAQAREAPGDGRVAWRAVARAGPAPRVPSDVSKCGTVSTTTSRPPRGRPLASQCQVTRPARR